MRELLNECLSVYNNFYNVNCIMFLESSECKRHLKDMSRHISNTLYNEDAGNYNIKDLIELHDTIYKIDYIVKAI